MLLWRGVEKAYSRVGRSIQGSGREIMRRGEQRVRDTLQLLGFHPMPFENFLSRRLNRSATGAFPQTSTEGQASSPLDNPGPIPAELRENPFPGESIPWGFQIAEIDRDRIRERLVWASAVVVSWLVAGALILRIMNIL